MTLKVLFVIYDNGSFDNVFPMGFGALGAVLKRDNHQISIWNQDIYHWPDDNLRSYLDENEFDVVILSLIAGYYQYQKMKSLSKAINASKNRDKFKYVMGGYGPTPEPKFFIEKSGCDVVCLGEGEVTVPELMRSFSNNSPLDNVPGIAWMDKGELKQTERAPLIEDLDSLPMPPYELFPMDIYRMLRQPRIGMTDFAFPMMSARGCTFKCTFCYRMDPGYRMRNPVHLLNEVEYLHKEYGITYIAFQDDLLMSSVHHTEEVCKEFLKRDLPVKWGCNGRLNYTSEELTILMREAGCVFINYGIESMDQTVLNNMKKGLTPRMIVSGIEATLKAGISPGLNFIFGNKGDNWETIKKSVDFLLKYDDFNKKRTIRPVTPYPGSPLYFDAIKMGLLDPENPAEDFYERKHLNSDLICCNFTELSDDEYYECLRWANTTLMKNYYDKQRDTTLRQIDYLYQERDVTFRGFRHDRSYSHSIDNKESKKSPHGSNNVIETNRELANRGNQVVDGMTNWENTSADGERFSQVNGINSSRKSLKSFEKYLQKKEARILERSEKYKVKDDAQKSLV